MRYNIYFILIAFRSVVTFINKLSLRIAGRAYLDNQIQNTDHSNIEEGVWVEKTSSLLESIENGYYDNDLIQYNSAKGESGYKEFIGKLLDAVVFGKLFIIFF